MNFVKKTNLPSKRVSILIIGQKYEDIFRKAFKKYDILPKFIPDNPCVDKRLSGHADLSVLHLGENRLILAKNLMGSDFLISLEEIGAEICIAKNEQNNDYPDDANLNVCMVDNKLVCNVDLMDAAIDNYLPNIELVNVKQGYARCSVCIVDRHSIITADHGIAAAAEQHGMAVLLVKSGLAALAGFDCGFIGGATFKLSGSELAFTGIIQDDMERNRIEKFLYERNIEAIYLTQNKLLDIGGVIPLMEY